MSNGARALLFGLAVVLAFATAFGLGRVVPFEGAMAEVQHGSPDGGSPAPDPQPSTSDRPAGLEASQDGYTLHLADTVLGKGRQRLEFHVLGPQGEPVTDYDVQHEKRLHLIVVRRDLTGFQHVHPRLDPADGSWTVDVDLRPGTWRVIADFKPTAAEPLVLGTDLSVPGRYDPRPLAEQRLTDSVDGYRVTLDGDLAAGVPTTLTTTVEREGEQVDDLQPYLGARGHLVALREGDLGYLHVHPDEASASAGVAFHTEFPTDAGYRLFLDFRHADVVRTAAFTVRPAATDTEPPATPRPTDDGSEGDDHGH